MRESTYAGLAAARARGRLRGRPKKLTNGKQLELARTLYAGGQTDIATICQALGISQATLSRSLKERVRAGRCLVVASPPRAHRSCNTPRIGACDHYVGQTWVLREVDRTTA